MTDPRPGDRVVVRAEAGRHLAGLIAIVDSVVSCREARLALVDPQTDERVGGLILPLSLLRIVSRGTR